MDKFGLSERTINTLLEYFKSVSQVETVKIFGSRARGNFKPYSDIDFVIYSDGIDLKLLNRIASGLDELPTPYKFDVLLSQDITEEKLLQNINNTGKIFYQKED